MLRILVVLYFSLFILQNSEAQILNVQKSDLQKDSTKFKGNITSSLSTYNRSAAVDEPVELFGFEFQSGFAFFFKNSRLTLLNKFDYLKINDDPFLNTGYQHVRYNLFEDELFHPEVFGQIQYDNFRGLFPRILGGMGFRYDFIENDKLSMFSGFGVMYEYEKWSLPNSNLFIEVDFLKSTNYLGWRWNISESFDANMIAYFQTAYDQSASVWRNRYSFEVNLNSKINKRFNITNSFSLGHEDQPIVPITKTIYNFTTGLNIVF
tara:strand:- start:49770 stop:50561 length:792 start_codon:yes stop_codon:yes gene_type:complete